MRRRDCILGLGTAVVASPLMAYAQNQSLPVIGFLSSRSASDSVRQAESFQRGLAESGYVPGQNCVIEFRWADGRYDRLPALAAELVHLPVTVLASVGGQQTATAAKAATSTLPIVFASGEDPVEEGLVHSLRRPEGNITGATFYTALLGAKRLGLLRELVPNAEVFGVLVNPLTPQGQRQTRDVREAAHDLGVRVVVANASTAEEMDAAFASLARQQVGALLVGGDPSFDVRRDRLVALAAQSGIPAVYHLRDFAAAGGLMSYGASIDDTYRQVGIYVARILGGAKPADLPVVQPSKFELAINLKTAKALGLTIPPLLLARADEIIE